MPLEITCIDSFIYCQANDGTNGIEPWISDGTVAGTHMLKDINSGALSSNPTNFISYNGKTYFAAADANGMELWISDGTATGTQMLIDINPGAGASNPDKLTVCNGKIFFRANNGTSGRELWMSDGTATGTALVKDIRSSGNSHSDPDHFLAYNGKTLFFANDGSSGTELWVTDGTATGTVMLKDINPGNGSGVAEPLTIFNNKVYFSGNGGNVMGNALWETDGTAIGTVLVTDPVPTPSTLGGITSGIAAANNYMFFVVDSSNNSSVSNHEPWISDGTAIGTKKLMDIYPGLGTGSRPEYVTVIGSNTFFEANDSTHGKELWVTNGTTAGTKLVKDVRAGTANGNAFSIWSYANKAFFRAWGVISPNGRNQLWVSDGTDTGTKKLVPPGATTDFGMSQNSALVAVCKKSMYFLAYFDSTGFELWSLRDTTLDTVTIPGFITHVNTGDNFVIAPNPAHDELKISLSKTYSDAIITITDIAGRVIRKVQIPGAAQSIEINLPGIIPGVYHVNLQYKDGSTTKRLLIE